MENIGKDKIFLIDGFPRNKDNVDGWNSKMSKICDLQSVIFYDCQNSELIKRIKHRSLDNNRDDDDDKVIKKRLQVYYKDTIPIIEYYTRLNIVNTINSQNLSIEEVHHKTISCLHDILLVTKK